MRRSQGSPVWAIDRPLHHSRHYTLEQAQAVRGWVTERVRWVRDARAALAELGERRLAAVSALDPSLGGGWPGRELARPLVELSWAMAELDAVEIQLRDVDRGLIDFPSLRDGEEVYLCWLVDDEAEVSFWHPVATGFAGRRPLA